MTVSKQEAPSRFRGFSAEIPRFFEALTADPCPDAWPADVRVTYAAHVLSPLKALVADLEGRLSDVSELVCLEARVGRSLSWPRGNPGPDDCPVSRVRAWGRGCDPESSPLLYADFTASGVEIGLEAPGGDAATAEELTPAGWAVAAQGSVGGPQLRVTRVEAWDDWIDEPAFASELAVRFRELLPLFERLVAKSPDRPPRSATIPEA